ncbi:MAG: hypothetical protein AAGD07_06520 [Planctomycetota bacterium]
MIYFILWAVFLLGCIVAVPVAQMMENRKRRALLGPEAAQAGFEDEEEAEFTDGEFQDEGVQEVASFEEGGGDGFEGMGDDNGFGEASADDFAAFDEEFK